MACSEQYVRDISDPWRVSSLIRAVVELLSALCVFFWVFLSVTTTRLLRSSKEVDDGTARAERASGTHLAQALLRGVVRTDGGSNPQGRLGFSERVPEGNRLLTSSSWSATASGGDNTHYVLQDSASSALSIVHNSCDNVSWFDCDCPLLLLRKEQGSFPSLITCGAEAGQTAPRVINVIHTASGCRWRGEDEDEEAILGDKTLESSDVDDKERNLSSTTLKLRNEDNGLRRGRRRSSNSVENESSAFLLDSSADVDSVLETETGGVGVEIVDFTISRVEEEPCECQRCSSSSSSEKGVKEDASNDLWSPGGGGGGGANEGKKYDRVSLRRDSSQRGEKCSSSCAPLCAGEVCCRPFLNSESSSQRGGPADDGCGCTTAISHGARDSNSNLFSKSDVGEGEVGGHRRGLGRRSGFAGFRECDGDAKDGGEKDSSNENDWNDGRRQGDATDGGHAVGAAAVTTTESLLHRRRRGTPTPRRGVSAAEEDVETGLSIHKGLLLLGGEAISSDWHEETDMASLVIEKQRRRGGSSLQGGDEAGDFESDGKNLDHGSLVRELERALQREKEALAELYLELEEERDASSIAANEAMAMITRLQEEKAAVQMEARHYQRMAEERQVYDEDAMTMLEEILMKRDEEMFALEEEVNSYRTRLLSARVVERLAGGGAAEGSATVTPVQLQHSSAGRVSEEGPMQVGSENGILVIERDSMAVDGSSGVDGNRKLGTQLDEKLVAEIKEWLRAAKEKGLPAKVEDLDVSGSLLRLGGSIGRKNLLESFCSVAAEESQKDGVKIEDVDTTRTFPQEEEVQHQQLLPTPSGGDSLAGDGSPQEMTKPIRRERSLRDDGVSLLDALKKLEKSDQQNSKGRERTEEEIIRTKKNTLRSFRKEGNEATKVVAAAAAQSPTPGDAETGVREGEDKRRTEEEKRVSVLEYVWKLEEQLHQLGATPDNRPPLATWRSAMVNAEVVNPLHSDSSLPGFKMGELVTASSIEKSDSDSNFKKSSTNDKPNSVRNRLRRLASGAKNVAMRSKKDRSNSTTGKEVGAAVRKAPADANEITPSRVSVTDEERRDHQNQHPVSSVALPANPYHDAFAQAQRKPHHNFPEANAFHKRNIARTASVEVKSCVSSPASELVWGEIAFSQQLAQCIEGVRVDGDCPVLPMGKDSDLDHARGQISQGEAEEKVFNEGMSRDGTGNCELALAEPGVCGQRSDSAGIWKDWIRSTGSVIPVVSLASNGSEHTLEENADQIVSGVSLERNQQVMQTTHDTLRRSGDFKNLLARQPSKCLETELESSVDSLPADDHAGFVKSHRFVEPLAESTSLKPSLSALLSRTSLVELTLSGSYVGAQFIPHCKCGDNTLLNIRTSPSHCRTGNRLIANLQCLGEKVESANGVRHAGQPQLSKLAHQLIRSGDSGTCHVDHIVGLSRLLHASPQDQQKKPIERARYLKAVDVA